MALGVGALPRICADLYVQSTTYYAHNLRFSRNIHVILGALAKVGRFSVGKLTVEQVAKLSGVSRSTVSRVINNHPNVKPGVRQRVLEVIAETGYHPNPAARSLASRRSGIIGLVIPRAVQSLFTDPYYPRLMQGVAQACNANDYTLSLFLFHTEDEEQKLYPRVLRTRLVDGVIVSASQIDDPLIPELINNHMPFVMVGRPNDLPQVNFVNVDNAVGAYAATSYLIRLGYKCIATITGPLNTTVGLDRRQGYRDALNDRSRSIDEALIVEGDFSELGGYAAMQRLIPHQPDAVFVASDTMAFGALRALREAGLSVPDDVAVLGFDDLPTSALSDPPLTTVRQPIRRVGAQAVEILIDILANGPEPPRRITLSTELVIRSSCASRSGA
jgi:LacI family transcriptional regulator